MGSDIGQFLGNGNGALPVLFQLVNFQKTALGFLVQIGTAQLLKNGFRTVKQSRFEKVLPQLGHGLQFEILRQIVTLDEVLVHTNGAFGLAPPAKQAAQRKVQFNGLRIDFHRLDEGFDGAILLFIEQKVQPLEVRTRQRARFPDQMLDVDARRQPAHAKKQGT